MKKVIYLFLMCLGTNVACNNGSGSQTSTMPIEKLEKHYNTNQKLTISETNQESNNLNDDYPVTVIDEQTLEEMHRLALENVNVQEIVNQNHVDDSNPSLEEENNNEDLINFVNQWEYTEEYLQEHFTPEELLLYRKEIKKQFVSTYGEDL